MSLALRFLAAVGLVVDAVIHLRLAGQYDPVTSGTISQGGLFRLEAVAAILAAVLMVAMRRRATDLFALSVAAGGVVAVLLYRYVEVGAIGPIPSMYEPIWYAEKTLSLAAQVVAAAAAAAVLVLSARQAKHGGVRDDDGREHGRQHRVTQER
jgi:hypothetical protein